MSVAAAVKKSASKIAKPIVEGAARSSGSAASKVAGTLGRDAATFSATAGKSVHQGAKGITKVVSHYSTELPSTKTFFNARKLLLPVFSRFSNTPEIDATAGAFLVATPVYWAGTAVTATVDGIVRLGKGAGRLARSFIQ